MIFYWRAQARRDIFIALIFHVALYYSDSLHLYYSIVQRKVCIGWIFMLYMYFCTFLWRHVATQSCRVRVHVAVPLGGSMKALIQLQQDPKATRSALPLAHPSD